MIGILGYMIFMVLIDVPLYVNGYYQDMSEGKVYPKALDTLKRSFTCGETSWDWNVWKSEAYWLTPYFSGGCF